MPKKWLQVKGDPSVRSFLFQQQRVDSLFDQRSERLHAIVYELLTNKGVFHAKIHYSSNQLTCWFYQDPYYYRVFVGEEVFSPGFLEQFSPLEHCRHTAVIKPTDILKVLAEFKRLRFNDPTVYLRNASINWINGRIGMTFSCDGSHYVEFSEFFATLETFGCD